ncbi:MAG: hypothetical protein A2571_00025 [Candidatus Vogelbacteria bacterium RIFOXYD1_FULL_44_32]|uniref:Uncharacterized protein n=1 Tax=Candidatus Vogelbacteria bacterium RIFOXYD1_FULL_44_32 TaxID=1802438 RepID=A0A1G2QDX8_9BACT|nr:MAG: hypothetical protein A2571_00025 [Candidatus Vogelbacteria bacterium RIFOXYD1_FULL_44_32]
MTLGLKGPYCFQFFLASFLLILGFFLSSSSSVQAANYTASVSQNGGTDWMSGEQVTVSWTGSGVTNPVLGLVTLRNINTNHEYTMWISTSSGNYKNGSRSWTVNRVLPDGTTIESGVYRAVVTLIECLGGTNCDTATGQTSSVFNILPVANSACQVIYSATGNGGGSVVGPSPNPIPYGQSGRVFFTANGSLNEVKKFFLNGQRITPVPASPYSLSCQGSPFDVIVEFGPKDTCQVTYSAIGSGGNISGPATNPLVSGQTGSVTYSPINSNYEVKEFYRDNVKITPMPGSPYSFTCQGQPIDVKVVFGLKNTCPVTYSVIGLGGTMSGPTTNPLTMGQTGSVTYSPTIPLYEVKEFYRDNVKITPVPLSPYSFTCQGQPIDVKTVFGPKDGCPITITKTPENGGTVATNNIYNGFIPRGITGSVNIADGNDGYVVSKIVKNRQVQPLETTRVAFLCDLTATPAPSHTLSIEYRQAAYRVISKVVGSGNGTINPLGASYYNNNQNAVYRMVPGTNNKVLAVFVDGNNLGSRTSYTFQPTTDKTRTIEASFIYSKYGVVHRQLASIAEAIKGLFVFR